MKSLVWMGPRRLEIQERPEPELAKGEVLLQVAVVGICGSDLSGYLGENSLRRPPLIMGHEFTGMVVATAGDVKAWKSGQVVTVNPLLSCNRCQFCRQGMRQLCANRSIVGIHRPGAFAEYLTVPASACHPVRNAIQGALVEPLACAVRANIQAKIQSTETLLVFGAGIIGLMSLRVAQEMGASRRIVVDPNPVRLEKAQWWGATDMLDPTHDKVTDEVRRLCPEGVDSVIDAVGLPQTRQDSIAVLRPGGCVVFIGLHLDETTIPGNHIVRQEIEIRGSFCYTDDNFQQALHLLENERVVPDASWLDIRPLEEGKQAFDEQIDGPATFPKILLHVRESLKGGQHEDHTGTL